MDYKMLDRMGFHALTECLDFVLEKIQTIEDEVGKDSYDPRLDRMYLVSNKIIVRMNTLVQQGSVPTSAENLAVWNQQIPEYGKSYEKYLDTFQDEEILFDSGK